ncbi:MAG: T9SS type A sorting domain-containing protein [Bacteroidia bacterium]
MVAFSNYGIYNLFYTVNGGKSWCRVAGNLYGGNGPSLRWAAIMHLNGGSTIYWVAASTGLYATDRLVIDSTGKSAGDSTKWVQQATTAIGNSVCNMVDIRPSDGLVAVATHTHGIYTANITSVNQIATVNNLSAPLPGMQLKVFPDPSRGQASVSFYLNEESNTLLRIFDMQGRIIKENSYNRMAMGEHVIPFDGSGLSNGIYYCTLQAGETVETVRMVIIK